MKSVRLVAVTMLAAGMVLGTSGFAAECRAACPDGAGAGSGADMDDGATHDVVGA